MVIRCTIDILATLGLGSLTVLSLISMGQNWGKQIHDDDASYAWILLILIFSLIAIWN